MNQYTTTAFRFVKLFTHTSWAVQPTWEGVVDMVEEDYRDAGREFPAAEFSVLSQEVKKFQHLVVQGSASMLIVWKDGSTVLVRQGYDEQAETEWYPNEEEMNEWLQELERRDESG